MLIRYGVAVNEMRGSAGGITIARNRFGSYLRSRTKPVNPKSSRQVAIRTIMMYLAEQWRESPMTDNIRTAWQTYADSVNWNNKLGEQVTLTGFNMFIAGNAALLTAGASLVTAAPAALGLPPGDPVFAVGSVLEAEQTFDVIFDDGFDWCTEADAFLLLYQGKPVSSSHNFFGGPYRYCGNIPGIDPAGAQTPAADNPQDGFTFVEGQKIWWEARIVRADGRISNRFGCDPTIVEAGGV